MKVYMNAFDEYRGLDKYTIEFLSLKASGLNRQQRKTLREKGEVEVVTARYNAGSDWNPSWRRTSQVFSLEDPFAEYWEDQRKLTKQDTRPIFGPKRRRQSRHYVERIGI